MRSMRFLKDDYPINGGRVADPCTQLRKAAGVYEQMRWIKESQCNGLPTLGAGSLV